MVSRSLHSTGLFAARLMVACALALALAGLSLAEPEYTSLKDEIKKLEKSVTEARDARNAADRKLEQNRRDQRNATDAKLAALKKDAIKLAKDAGDKADALTGAEQKLADKQGELRKAAADHAVKQITAAGNWMSRAQAANKALDDWKAALGSLPEVPKLRPLDGIVDPQEQARIRKQDKASLEAFDAWAVKEEKRVDEEIKQADELIKAEPKWSKVDDKEGDLVVSTTKALKKTLESRKKRLGELRKATKDRIAEIK
jgi:hypothetical protein